jgi:hypothetical protein
MKKLKVLMTGAVILLAVGGAFASKYRTVTSYTYLGDMFPGQTQECQIRNYCSGTGALCTMTYINVSYQLYYYGCVVPANGFLVQH